MEHPVSDFAAAIRSRRSARRNVRRIVPCLLALLALMAMTGAAHAVGACECTNCELASGTTTYRYQHDEDKTSTEEDAQALRTAKKNARTEANAAQPLCEAPCTASDVHISLTPTGVASTPNYGGYGEARVRWRVTGSCKKPREPERKSEAQQPPQQPNNPPPPPPPPPPQSTTAPPPAQNPPKSTQSGEAWHTLSSPLACESNGIIYDGRSKRSKKASEEGNDYDEAELDAEDQTSVAEARAKRTKLRCEADCALSFFPTFFMEFFAKRDPDYIHWAVVYQCKKPPPTIINMMVPPKKEGSGSSNPPAGTGVANNPGGDICKDRKPKLTQIEADEEKAERAGRDIQAQIDAAVSRGEEPSQDLLQQAQANSSARAANRAWIKVLKQCELEKRGLLDFLPNVSIGVGVGGGRGAPHGGTPNGNQNPNGQNPNVPNPGNP